MIIKFKVLNSWHYFSEVNHFQYQVVKNRDNQPKPEGLIDFTAMFDVHGEGFIEMSFLNKNQTRQIDIATYGPVYMMDDSGKTIEIITNENCLSNNL